MQGFDTCTQNTGPRRHLIRHLHRVVALVGVCAAVLLGTAQRTLGASAAVTAAPQPTGSVLATATGSFASCVVCDTRNAAGQCTTSHTVNYGSITLSRDGSYRCAASGNGTATCTSSDDRGGLHGTHGFSATASDCTGSASSRVPLTLDNTPTVTVTAPTGVVSGPFDITGTATFTPTLRATKGSIYLYVNNAPTYIATVCPTETCTFAYRELTGTLYALHHGGPYTVQLVAVGGGTSASDQKTFSVDRMPRVTVTAPRGAVRSPFDITGTATFSPTLRATKGSIYAYINNADTYIAMVCPTETCTFAYRELAGHL